MRERAKRLALAVMIAALGFFPAGCATAPGGGTGGTAAGPSQAELLLQAGFKVVIPSTPEKAAYVKSLPLKQVVANTYSGQVHYLVRTDSGSPQCYIGNQAAYERYQQLAAQAALAAERHKVADHRWDPEALTLWADSQGGGP